MKKLHVPFKGKKKGEKRKGIIFTESCRQQLLHFERSSTLFSFAFLKKRKITMKFLFSTGERSKISFLICAIK